MVRLSDFIKKQVNAQKEKAYKETEARISAFRMAQIVREREKTVENPGELYEEVLKKVLSFWEKLTKKESFDSSSLKNIVEKHPKVSLEMLKKEKSFSENIIQIVFQHHERSSGRGYPQGLIVKEIHPGARIVALADAFEAMTHPRLYHKAKLPYEVLIELIEEKDKNFDKTILKVLIQELTFYPLGTFVELNTGEVVVERTSKDFPTQPKVRVVISEGGEKMEPPREVNLSRERLLYIRRPIFAPVEQVSEPG